MLKRLHQIKVTRRMVHILQFVLVALITTSADVDSNLFLQSSMTNLRHEVATFVNSTSVVAQLSWKIIN